MVVLQFFLAGRGTFTAAFEAHRALGFVLLLVALLTVVVGAVARPSRGALMRSIAVLVLMLLQPIIAGLGKGLGADSMSTGGLLFGLHAANGVVIVGLLALNLSSAPSRSPSPVS